jgi:acetylornithine deacetylase/succinyl-diaminopimelate desuccinylase-like protein
MVEPAQWPADKAPFAGILDGNGELWGRGALDMKGLGALELNTLRWLKRLGVPLNRDIILLAVPDEEVDSRGMAFLMEKHWDRLKCSHVINEGGMGIRDMLIQGQTVFTISVAEKGVLWLRMTAHGESGHGSVYLPGRAPERLNRAVARILERKPAAVVHASYLELLARVGEQQGGLTSFILRRPLLTETALGAYALRTPMMRGAVSNTVQVTGFSGARQPNVVPSEVSAQLDCRLLPGVTPASMLEELRVLVDDPQVSFEVLHQAVGTGSTRDDPLFRALATHAVKDRPDAVAAPVMGPLYSDSVPLRTLGVRAYGFTPFEVTQDMLRTMHGKDERVGVKNLHRGLKVLLGAVLEVSTP